MRVMTVPGRGSSRCGGPGREGALCLSVGRTAGGRGGDGRAQPVQSADDPAEALGLFPRSNVEPLKVV